MRNSIQQLHFAFLALVCAALLACGGLACEEVFDARGSNPPSETSDVVDAGIDTQNDIEADTGTGAQTDIAAETDRDTAEAQERDAPYGALEGQYIDTHNHLIMQMQESCEFEDAAANTIEFMDRHDIAITLVMPQPGAHGAPCPVEGIYEAVAAYPDRFAVVDGGGSLSAMILSIPADEVTQADVEEFRSTAHEIVDRGAVAFGELTAEHFSFADWHGYSSTSPNHPLFLELADIGAETGLPLDIHMEAIAFDMDFTDIDPASGADSSENNPERLYENLTAFEELLDYQPNANIIWVHAGWDSTGHRTAQLTGDLLAAHDNLYIQLRPMPAQSPLPNSLMVDGELDSAWLQVFTDFPDRFVIGMDSMYDHDPLRVDALLAAGSDFVDVLPETLRSAIAYENAVQLYGLDDILE